MNERAIASYGATMEALRRERRKDFDGLHERLDAVHEDLGTINSQLSSWAGARSALLWVFGAITALASIVAAVWAAISHGA